VREGNPLLGRGLGGKMEDESIRSTRSRDNLD